MSFPFNTTKPADSDRVSDHPADERTVRTNIAGSIDVDHDAEGDGKHKQVTLKEQGAGPTTGANEGAVYTKAVSGVTELFYRGESAAAEQRVMDAEGPFGALSRLAAASATARRMLANLLFSNAIAIQGRDVGDTAWIDLLQLDASDRVLLGDTDAVLRTLLNDYGRAHFYDGTTERALATPRGYIDGFVTSRASATTISVAAGMACSEDGTRTIVSTGAQTLDIATTGAGGLEASVASDTAYYVWKILNSANGDVEVFGSVGLSPTLPGSYDKKRLVGWFLTDGSSEVIDYHQNGDLFLWKAPPLDFSDNDPGTSAVLKAISAPPDSRALITIGWEQTSGVLSPLYVSSPYQDDEAPVNMPNFRGTILDENGLNWKTANLEVLTNASRQIRYRVGISSTVFMNVACRTRGFYFARGRDT